MCLEHYYSTQKYVLWVQKAHSMGIDLFVNVVRIAHGRYLKKVVKSCFNSRLFHLMSTLKQRGS